MSYPHVEELSASVTKQLGNASAAAADSAEAAKLRVEAALRSECTERRAYAVYVPLSDIYSRG